MKIKKVQLKKYNLIQLYLLKFQTYKNTHNIKTNFINLKIIEQMMLYIKHAFHIIYQYHFSGKTILFIGLPNVKQKNVLKIFKLSKHFYIPDNLWINGLLSNKISIFRHLKHRYNKRDTIMNLISIKKNPNLIVVFNSYAATNAILESHNINIPIINLGTDSIVNGFATYKIPGIFFRNKIKFFFQFLIYSILKKSKIDFKYVIKK
jgi:ribosomal protein S2